MSWLKECRHGNEERWCNECYDFARAQSEEQEHGTWRPPPEKVARLVDSVLKEFGEDCAVYMRIKKDE